MGASITTNMQKIKSLGITLCNDDKMETYIMCVFTGSQITQALTRAMKGNQKFTKSSESPTLKKQTLKPRHYPENTGFHIEIDSREKYSWKCSVTSNEFITKAWVSNLLHHVGVKLKIVREGNKSMKEDSTFFFSFPEGIWLWLANF